MKNEKKVKCKNTESTNLAGEQINHTNKSSFRFSKMANKKGNNGGSNGGTKNKQQIQDSHDYSSFKVVLFYSSLIVFLPVLTFFLLKATVLDHLFTLSEVRSNIYSAVGAVVALHLALGLYIYRAYFGSAQPMYNKLD